MRILATLTDKEVYPGKSFPEVLEWTDRRTVKIILRNAAGKIALITKPAHGCHLLPGGGIEEGEDVLAAADRESREEAGYSLKNGRILGIVEEYRSQDSKRYETYGVVAESDARILGDFRTVEEKRDGLSVAWHTLDETLLLFMAQEKRLRTGDIPFYNTGFNILRDRLFFDLAREKGLLC